MYSQFVAVCVSPVWNTNYTMKGPTKMLHPSRLKSNLAAATLCWGKLTDILSDFRADEDESIQM
jgi:hypothetical protein